MPETPAFPGNYNFSDKFDIPKGNNLLPQTGFNFSDITIHDLSKIGEIKDYGESVEGYLESLKNLPKDFLNEAKEGIKEEAKETGREIVEQQTGYTYDFKTGRFKPVEDKKANLTVEGNIKEKTGEINYKDEQYTFNADTKGNGSFRYGDNLSLNYRDGEITGSYNDGGLNARYNGKNNFDIEYDGIYYQRGENGAEYGGSGIFLGGRADLRVNSTGKEISYNKDDGSITYQETGDNRTITAKYGDNGITYETKEDGTRRIAGEINGIQGRYEVDDNGNKKAAISGSNFELTREENGTIAGSYNNKGTKITIGKDRNGTYAEIEGEIMKGVKAKASTNGNDTRIMLEGGFEF